MIVITTMTELPERCYECPLCHETNCKALKININNEYSGYQMAQEIRPYNCPLKEIQEIENEII